MRRFESSRPSQPVDRTYASRSSQRKSSLLHPAFDGLWADIKLWSGDARLGIARIKGTARHRKVFASVKSPLKKQKPNVSDEEVLAFIRHLVVLATDFQLDNSNYRIRHAAALRLGGMSADEAGRDFTA